MAKFPMDLSKFKKVSGDEKHSVLQHPQGHSITIAHIGVSPETRKQLISLPIHKAKGGPLNPKLAESKKEPRKFAGGGQANKDDVPELPPDTPNIITSTDPIYSWVKSKLAPSPSPSPQSKAHGGEIKHYAEGAAPVKADDDLKAEPIDPNSDEAQAPAQGASPAVHISINAAPQPQQQPAPGAAPPPPAQFVPGASPPGPQATVGANPNAPAPAEPLQAEPMGSDDQATQAAPEPGEDEAETAPQASASQPQAAPQQQAVPQQLTPQQAAKQQLDQEDAAWQHDLVNQHITPETYSSLFAKKDTLGKIGTIFGMVLSGAGSGLTGQPNALLGMMDKQIQNDLHAQTQSKTNAQNYLRLNQQNLMNQAQVKNLNVETQAKAYALTQAQMLQSSYHAMVQNVDKMPDGPQKQAAQQTLGLMYNGIKDRINNINDQAAGASAYYNMLFGQNAGPAQNQETAFQKQMTGMKMLGPQGEARAKDLEAKHFPGIPGYASAPISDADKETLRSGTVFNNQLNRFMDWTSKHSGEIKAMDPSDVNAGETMAAELQGDYRQATKGGVFKEGEQNFISKVIDSDPTKFFNAVRVMPKLQALSNSIHSRLDTHAKTLGFPQGYPTLPKPGAQSDTVNVVHPNGQVGAIPRANLQRAIQMGYKVQ